MAVGVLSLHLFLPGCTSLKAKRSKIKPVLARLHREFNLSTAEMDRCDQWQQSVLACAIIGNDHALLHAALQHIVDFFPKHWPDLELVEYHIEIL